VASNLGELTSCCDGEDRSVVVEEDPFESSLAGCLSGHGL